MKKRNLKILKVKPFESIDCFKYDGHKLSAGETYAIDGKGRIWCTECILEILEYLGGDLYTNEFRGNVGTFWKKPCECCGKEAYTRNGLCSKCDWAGCNQTEHKCKVHDLPTGFERRCGFCDKDIPEDVEPVRNLFHKFHPECWPKYLKAEGFV